VVYSIGADRHDDGGRPSDPPDAAMVISFGPTTPEWQHDNQGHNDGDWILWPPIKAARVEEADDERAPVQEAE